MCRASAHAAGGNRDGSAAVRGVELDGKRVAAIGGEFFRYVVVGGIAFLADFGTIVVVQEFFFRDYAFGVYAATGAGFAAGLAVNYVLSLMFVFTQRKDKGKGRSIGAFVVFGAIGVLGLLLTEAGMWVGIELFGWNYMVAKIFTTAVVLLWNYAGRKILIFN